MQIQMLKQLVQECGKVTVRLTDELWDESWSKYNRQGEPMIFAHGSIA